jgi:hypothetical protein
MSDSDYRIVLMNIVHAMPEELSLTTMERRIFGQNYLLVFIHCMIIIPVHLFMRHSWHIHCFELNSYFHIRILNTKVHHHDATRCTMAAPRTHHRHGGVMHRDWGQHLHGVIIHKCDDCTSHPKLLHR